MKKQNNRNGEITRSPRVIGATVIISSILVGLMLLAAHLRMDTSTKASERVDDACIISSMTSTVTNFTTSSTTTKKTTTKTTTTTTETTTTKIETTTTESQTIAVVTDPITEPPAPEPVTESPAPEPYVEPAPQPEPEMATDLPVTEYERILLCNVVAREYGSDWVSVAEKAKVVAVVMNRVADSRYPNTIEGVLTQPYQFSGYYACNYEWANVTESVREAVRYYFAHTDEFPYYLSFWGDGTYNHFS